MKHNFLVFWIGRKTHRLEFTELKKKLKSRDIIWLIKKSSLILYVRMEDLLNSQRHKLMLLVALFLALALSPESELKCDTDSFAISSYVWRLRNWFSTNYTNYIVWLLYFKNSNIYSSSLAFILHMVSGSLEHIPGYSGHKSLWTWCQLITRTNALTHTADYN